jgi:transcriptional regulator with XRE-family HTH domain
MFDKLAEEMKAAREKSSMTLAQVANKSKIDIKFLEAMEHGDFAFLPELYVRAFVKDYAKTVGLDENKIIKKYDAAKKGIPYVEETTDYEEILRHSSRTANQEIPPQAVLTEKPSSPKDKVEKKKIRSLTFDAVGGSNPVQDAAALIKRRNLIIGVFFLGAILLFSIVYFLFLNKSEQIIVAEKPIEDVIRQNQRYIEDDQSTASGDLGIGAADSLLLTINANDTSWIKVSVDGQASEEFILLPGSQKAIKANYNYNITFGNSGAIKLLLNNKPLRFTGKSKSVLSVLIDRKGIKYSDNSSSQR